MTDEVAATDPLIATTLGGTYVLDKMLGEGGMGRVYRAHHTRIVGKQFAIKVLHEEYAQNREVLERFKREAEAAALISSPHVVGVHDYGQTHDGRPYLVCDFLVGEELAERLERVGQLPVGEAVRIVRQICSGLAMAHANGVIHRDVKPENVFLEGADEHLSAKLLDFGISRFREGGDKKRSALTQAGVALGTPDFMSPEQAKGAAVDHRADIYAVGVMLYHALTGVMPFERDSPHATLLALLSEEAPPPRELVPSIPEHLEMIIQKAMAKEADDRYGWIAELNQALAPYDTSQPTQLATAAPRPAQPTDGNEEAREAKSARAWLVAALALGVPAVFGGALLAVVGVLRAVDIKVGATAWLLTLVALLFVLATPLVLVVRHVASCWGNTARAVGLARACKAMLFASAGAYAIAALSLRLAAAMASKRAAPWPLWDLVLLLLVTLVGFFVFARAQRRQRG